jgi:hypothetical protein
MILLAKKGICHGEITPYCLGKAKKKENEYGKPPPPKIDFKGLFGF